MRSLGLVFMTVMLGIAPVAAAQEAPSSAPAPLAPPVTQAIDPTKLGIDLNKVQQGLAVKPSEERLSADGLRFSHHVDVFGKAPPLDLFKDFDPAVGPVPFGAPTHKDFLDMVTPPQFRAPMLNFSALAFWAFGKLGEINERKRCEAELAIYRGQVMRGVPVAAPDCAR